MLSLKNGVSICFSLTEYTTTEMLRPICNIRTNNKITEYIPRRNFILLRAPQHPIKLIRNKTAPKTQKTIPHLSM